LRLILCATMVMLAACEKSDLDKHRDVTSQMLAARGASDFVDASTAEHAAIQHTPSGMLCVLPASGAVEFDVFPASAANAGAQCSSSDDETVSAWVAVNFREPTTLDAAFGSAIAQLTNGLEARPWPGQPSEADRSSPEGLPHYRINRFTADFNGERRYVRLAMAEKDGWYLQQIVSAPASAAGEAEAEAGEVWREGLRTFAAHDAP
jgi:hypothetical protein